MTDSLYWLALTALSTAFMALPYVMERISRVGLIGALGYSSDSHLGGFDQPTEKPAAWAKRAHAAHRNAIESLPIIATLVLIAHAANITGGNTIALATMTYFIARILHYVVYALGVPVLRTLAFFVAWAAILLIGYEVVIAAV
ncbi:MAG: MAPEG family protein [Hyphomicrobiaceae bacterium]